MNFFNWLFNKVGTSSVSMLDSQMNAYIQAYADETSIRELAFYSTVNVIANSISKCEFLTYEYDTKQKKVVETKSNEYYLWNVQPNKNQNSTEFLHKLITQLYKNRECLVIEQNNELYVADDFMKTPLAFYEDTFSNVVVKDYSLNRTFKQSEVLYFNLNNEKVNEVLDRLSISYSKLFYYALRYYNNSHAEKGKFKFDTMQVGNEEDQVKFNEMLNKKIKNYMDNPDSTLPLGEGQDYLKEQYQVGTSRDIRALIDDICDFTAKSLGVPPILLKGDIQDVSCAIDQLLTFCIDPLVDMIQEEINRKRIGREAYLQGTKIIINTNTIKHIDLFSVSTAIDKIISSGCVCVNDIRKAMGLQIIDEEWANRFFMTKNYATIEELLNSMKGENTENENMGTKTIDTTT